MYPILSQALILVFFPSEKPTVRHRGCIKFFALAQEPILRVLKKERRRKLIDNSARYTLQATIEVSLKRLGAGSEQCDSF